MNKQSQSRAIVPKVIGVLLAIAAIALLAKQQHDIAQMRQDNEQLQARAEALEADIAQARSAGAAADITPPTQSPKAAHAKSKSSHAKAMLAAQQQNPTLESGSDGGDRGSTKGSVSPTIQNTEHSPSPRNKKLIFESSSVESTANGLTATLHFKNSGTTPLGLVALALRTEPGSNARILSFAPVGLTSSSEETSEVAENGKFAFYQGTADMATNVTFVLSLSEASTLDARGTCGMTHLRLNIQPGAATVESVE